MINEFSTKHFGRELVTIINGNEVFINFGDRLKISFAVTIICLIYYLLSRIVFYVCSTTYK